MAKTGYLNVAPELEDRFYQDLQSQDRYIIPRIRAKAKALSRAQKANVASRSYLKQCRDLWDNLTNEQKQAWKDVDPYPNPNGWHAFIADQSIRIKQELAGTATPNQYHQDLVGKINITGPAEEIKLKQSHPHTYWLYQRVTGKIRMYEMAEVEEVFSLPLKIGISYKSNLVSTGEGSFAKLYADIRHLYQGVNRSTNLEIDIPLIAGWTKQDTTETTLIGQAISYNLYIHLYKVTGELLFDNIIAEHNAQNWARDPFCKEINRKFKRQFSQVLDHWEEITLPTGATYESIYPT